MIEHPQGLWLWVARPDRTQDECDDRGYGPDQEGLKPGFKSLSCAEGWWTCGEATRAGDLALLYRTAPYMEVRWLVKTHGNRCSLANDAVAQREGWNWGTGYEVLASFNNTLAFAEMSNSQPLARWDAIDRKLHGGHVLDEKGVWPVPMVYWRAMITRLVRRNPDVKTIVAEHTRPTPDWLS